MARSANSTVTEYDFSQPAGSGLPFEINSFADLPSEAQSPHAHRHAFYEVLYLFGGEGLHVLDFESLKIQTPCFYFISPGQVHFWNLEQPLRGRALLFTDTFLLFPPAERSLVHELSFFYALSGEPVVHLAPEQDAEARSLLQSIEAEYLAERQGRSSIIRAYFHILLVKMQRLYSTSRKTDTVPSVPPLVRRFKQRVATSYRTERSVTAYAQALGVSESHLFDAVKRATGSTPGAIIRREVALEGRRLLAHTDLSVAEIGYHLKFEDASYFGRFFRREAGESPAKFRRSMWEKYQPVRVHK